MSKYNIRDVDELVECPYDPLHMIRVSRFPYHLIKCAKVHPHVQLSTCPFNARHRVRATALRYHQQSCRDKILIEQDVLLASAAAAAAPVDDDTKSLTGNLNLPSQTPSTVEGDWDFSPATADKPSRLKDLSKMSAEEKIARYHLAKENFERQEQGKPLLASIEEMRLHMESLKCKDAREPSERPRIAGLNTSDQKSSDHSAGPFNCMSFAVGRGRSNFNTFNTSSSGSSLRSSHGYSLRASAGPSDYTPPRRPGHRRGREVEPRMESKRFHFGRGTTLANEAGWENGIPPAIRQSGLYLPHPAVGRGRGRGEILKQHTAK